LNTFIEFLTIFYKILEYFGQIVGFYTVFEYFY
jgi:hypothetical protein